MRWLPLLLLATPAYAQETCAERAPLVDTLRDEYGEDVRLGALVPNGNIIEFYANEDGGGWTLLVSTPDGIACIISVGEGFIFTAPGELM